MRRILAVLLAGWLLTAWASPPPAPKPPQPFFNAAAFAGLAELRGRAYADAALDFELDDPAGKPIAFKNCPQAEATRDDAVAAAQFALLRLLKLNCMALKRFLASQSARETHFAPRLSRREIASWPASAVPLLNAADGARRAGKLLGRYDKSMRVSIRPDGTAVVRTRGDEVQFVVMARADFDGDGVEDLLLRADWSANGAGGQASDLILLGRKTDQAPALILWRP